MEIEEADDDDNEIVSAPTRGKSILDLVLTTHPGNMIVHILDCLSDDNALHRDV